MAVRRADGERTRERVIAVALPLFAELGYAGTSIRRVADAAGVNVATLAYHFDGKEGLYATVVQRLHEELLARWPSTLPQGDALAFYVALAWRFACEHRVHMRLLLRHVLDRGAHPPVVMDGWSGPLIARADALVRSLSPELSAVERRLLLLSLVHLIARFVIEDRAQLALLLDLPGGDAGVVDPEVVDAEVIGWLTRWLRRALQAS